MENNIAILIIFFNKLAQTISCIESFIPSGQNIYILNNASKTSAWNALQKQFINNKCIFFYNSNINLGPAGGRNLLLQRCKEEWVFLVDNDICITPERNWKQLFDEKVLNEQTAKIFCPSVFNVHENAYSNNYKFIETNGTVHLQDTNEKITNYFSCCAVIINKSIFNTYGNFDEELFAFEDYEFSIRAMLSDTGNLAVYRLDNVEVIHDHQIQKTKQDKKAVLERYNETRIKKSMDRILIKHGIALEHDWQWWTKKQISDMNGKSFVGKIKDKVLTYLKN